MQENIELTAESTTGAGVLNEVDAEEIAEIMQHVEIHPRDADKLASTVVYINKRFIEKQSRYNAFKKAFPHRCIPQENTNTPYPNTKEEISRTSIEIKAKRLEQSQLYKKVVVLLQTNLYIGYAMERYVVVDKVLERIMDEDISNRDLAPLVKVFFDETRKPEESKGLEINLNVGDNETMKSIDEKLSYVSDKLDGKSADEIIDVLAIPKDIS